MPSARWGGGALDVLEKCSGIGLLRFLRRSRQQRKSETAAVAALDALIGYLEPRVAYTDHVEYKAKGYAIGSGMMESTCKQVVAQRLEGSGRQWSDPCAVWPWRTSSCTDSTMIRTYSGLHDPRTARHNCHPKGDARNVQYAAV